MRGRNGSRGWPARGARLAGGVATRAAWGRVRRAEAEQGRGEEAADGWARARKIKKQV